MGRTKSGRIRRWARTAPGEFTVSSTSVLVDLLAGLEAELGRAVGNLTVQRILLTLAVRPSIAGNTMRWGIVPVSEQAFAIGASAVPKPVSELDAAWMGWDQFTVHPDLGETASGLFTNSQVTHCPSKFRLQPRQ